MLIIVLQEVSLFSFTIQENANRQFFSFWNKKKYTLFLEFCPADCNWEKEMMCPGKFDAKTGEQMSGDYCIPMQNGDCWNQCPLDCGKDMVCPGGMDPKGCPMPDMCFPAGKDCPKM